MKLRQGLWVHGLALVVASGLALKTWTAEDKPASVRGERVQVWPGKIEQLESVRFESDKRNVKVAVHKDAAGRWYEVHVDREIGGAAHPPLGAGGAAPVAPPPKRETKKFVSVTEGEKLAESLAPLMALRSIGRVEGAREKEFGFEEPGGTLFVRVAGKEHALLIGGVTPGGADRYARVKESGEVFAVPGDLVRRLEQAESRLFERELVNFSEQEPNRVRIADGARSRELVAVEGKLGGWAEASAPEEQDETASNWMGKVAKLRARSYLEESKELEGQRPVVTVQYFQGTKQVAALELFKLPAEAAATGDLAVKGPAAPTSGARFVARSDHSRWPVEVGSTAAEIEQDLTSILD